tara:strand:- start:529 stop:1059 length:531 start_codon:yes stop_codon:yes gene_type:complete
MYDSMIKAIYKNFLSNKQFLLLKKYMSSCLIDWHFFESTLPENFPNKDNNYLLAHAIKKNEYYSNPNWINFHKKLEESIEAKLKITRVKCNLYLAQHTIVQHAFHKDLIGEIPDNCITAVFNLTTCNGYTIVGDKKIMSKENELIVFPADTMHCGAVQTNTQTRIVININGEKNYV